jgi:hypothetical protein
MACLGFEILTAGYSINMQETAVKEMKFKCLHILYHRVMKAETVYATFTTSRSHFKSVVVNKRLSLFVEI